MVSAVALARDGDGSVSYTHLGAPGAVAEHADALVHQLRRHRVIQRSAVDDADDGLVAAIDDGWHEVYRALRIREVEAGTKLAGFERPYRGCRRIESDHHGVDVGILQKGLDDLQVGFVIRARIDVDRVSDLDQGIELLGQQYVFNMLDGGGLELSLIHI